MKTVLVSLVSEQTIPNVELIREMQDRIDQYLFITTDGMERSGQRSWILNAARISDDFLIDSVSVNPFSFEDIEEKLNSVVDDENFYIVNLTGGTKVMSLAIYDFFKTLQAEMYYLTGRGEKIKIYPGRKKAASKLKQEISLEDYLLAYGFIVKNRDLPSQTRKVAENCLSYFLHKFNKDEDIPVLEELRPLRSSKKKTIVLSDPAKAFLNRIQFQTQEKDKITKYECRYVTGDWLEEYLYYVLVDEFNVAKSSIGLGVLVSKNGIDNEFDVMLMKNNKIYIFECKTSIYTDVDESNHIFGETIYKSDALTNKLGLFAQTTIVTLSDLERHDLSTHIKRAEANKVKLIGKSAFVNDSLVEELKKI